MKLIIKDNNFTTRKINFRNIKSGIKLMYSINNIFMIGIPLKVEYNKINIKGSLIHINVCNKCIDTLKKIDNYFLEQIPNYVSFLSDNIIKIKKHGDFLLDDKNILFTINSIKVYKDKNYAHIFTI